uniref:Bifunctional inhibitor/plant lipid transfer protein/seed storage helical domain-containing protein n=1 Tax=Physcomitrium patens TaxID=3218 RepID=A0A2K1JT66_PHYPA|nr:hypothetical protein PHYPA_014495 [Physcomitrium patens]
MQLKRLSVKSLNVVLGSGGRADSLRTRSRLTFPAPGFIRPAPRNPNDSTAAPFPFPCSSYPHQPAHPCSILPRRTIQHTTCVSLPPSLPASAERYKIHPPPLSLSTFITRSRCLSTCLRHPEFPIFFVPSIRSCSCTTPQSQRHEAPRGRRCVLDPACDLSDAGHFPSSRLRRLPTSAVYCSQQECQREALQAMLLQRRQHGQGASGSRDVFQLAPCIAASKNANVRPSRQCCSNVASMGKGLPGANCLCSLLNHPLARSQGVAPRIALGIPQKCRIAVPRGFVCQDTLSRLLPR